MMQDNYFNSVCWMWRKEEVRNVNCTDRKRHTSTFRNTKVGLKPSQTGVAQAFLTSISVTYLQLLSFRVPLPVAWWMAVGGEIIDCSVCYCMLCVLLDFS